jgi:hypothetical protein
MRGTILCLLAGAALCGATSAMADPRSYCEAYARDAATARLSGSSILTGLRQQVAPAAWQQAYDVALADCLASHAARPADARPLKRLVTSKPATAVASAGPLTAGSPAWIDYCSKKYVSFDAKTGLYTGLSGKKRPCLVTRN